MPEPIIATRIAENASTEGALESLRDAIAFSSADWGEYRDLAWIYGIVLGWDDEDDPDGETMRELAERFGWTAGGIARLRRLHAEFVRLAPEVRP